jgi:hypothetical protein
MNADTKRMWHFAQKLEDAAITLEARGLDATDIRRIGENIGELASELGAAAVQRSTSLSPAGARP